MKYTESYIEKQLEAIQQLEWIAKSHHDALVRVRKVIEQHWNQNICSLLTYQEIIKAMDGEQ